jgi:hypothetical protein
MKFTKIQTLLLIAIAILLIFGDRSSSSVKSGNWTVYGSMKCGWTRKQIDYMKDNSIEYEFIDCDSGKCEGIKGFPTMVHKDGTRIEGFKEV